MPERVPSGTSLRNRTAISEISATGAATRNRSAMALPNDCSTTIRTFSGSVDRSGIAPSEPMADGSMPIADQAADHAGR